MRRFKLDATLTDELNRLPCDTARFEGFTKICLGGVVSVNIGMVETGDSQIDTGMDEIGHLPRIQIFTPNTPGHGAGYDPGKLS